MAKPRLYNHTRFDGGMTHNNRDTADLTKSSFIAHLDIYRENHRAYVMPGFVSDNGFGGSATGLKVYDIQAFNTANFEDRIYAVGKKADGTGSKILERKYSESEWTLSTAGAWTIEGTADLVNYPFLHYKNPDFYYPVKDTDGNGTWIAESGPNAIGDHDDDWQTYISFSNINGRFTLKSIFTGDYYFSQTDFKKGLTKIDSSGITIGTVGESTFIRDFESGDYLVGVTGMRLNPRRGQTVLWDAASLLADQNLSTGKGVPIAIGYPSNIWATVNVGSSSEAETNGQSDVTVRLLAGESPQVIFKKKTVSEINRTTEAFALNDQYKDSMLWYLKLEESTGVYKQGIFALGRGGADSQYGTSMLLDTTTLSSVRNTFVNGNTFWFIHNEDGSVSRLDDFETGTFDVPGYIETLFYGSDTPFLKQLEGISVTTENLPAGGTVEVQYRTDENVAFTSMGTSDTDDKQVHNFTKVAGVPIGKFREIQFKIILTGKIALKSYLVSTTENDDLSFSV